ncbi:TetR family transcriptional regulator [Herbaspirillum lusitanum]|uniref:TetR/AcrR family transcriptional regulator n=1 Tax=Herbaspirillum lusitanum TaxID=213312 RepID=UPI002238B79F|nr:TetR/AcrR family transcriptional regulator [Herbaspirillum lusitanum]MCW5297767.1 TetR family transcriptional regulator [Herbaspirillum lusitanum]
MGKPSVREKVISAGLEIFHIYGFNASAVQDITTAAGIPKGSFFNHFKSKELMALAALSRYQEQTHTEMLLDKKQAPLQRLRCHFEFLAGRHDQWEYERSCMIADFGTELSRSHPRIRAAVRDGYIIWSGLIAQVLREAQATREINSKLDVDQIARFLLNSWQGSLIRMKAEKSRTPLNDFFTLAFEFILN